jgi:hypothetical protein
MIRSLNAKLNFVRLIVVIYGACLYGITILQKDIQKNKNNITEPQ